MRCWRRQRWCLSTEQSAKLQLTADEAVTKAEAAMAERNRALERAHNAENAANEASSRVDALEVEKVALKKEVEAERARYEQERLDADRERQVVELSAPDTLVAVHENQPHRGSSCTILEMRDGTRRFMKTSRFDPNGSVTAKARGLIGRRVSISSWDPVGEPGLWSGQGYFRQVYAAE